MAEPPEPTLTVVVPAFNEAPGLPALLEVLGRACEPWAGALELLLVDDGSQDDTPAVASALAGHHPELRVWVHHRNLGKEEAIRSGLLLARGRRVAVLDADLQHPPQLLGAMMDLMDQGAVQVVEGVKAWGDGRGLRGLCNHCFYALLRLRTGLSLDGSSDFKLLGPEAVASYRQRGGTPLFFRLAVARLGLPGAQVVFEVPRRALGRSKWPPVRLCAYALKLLLLAGGGRRRAPLPGPGHWLAGRP